MRKHLRECVWFLLVALVNVGLLLASATLSTAANRFWRNNAGNGNWNDPTKWSSVSAADVNPANNGVPLAGETIHIVHNDGIQHFVTYNVTAPSLDLVIIDQTGAGTAPDTLTITSNNSLTANGIFVGGFNGGGSSGRGAISQNAGSVTTNPGFDLLIGNGTLSTGVYTITGTGSLTVGNNLRVGNDGTGTMNIQGQSSVYVTNALNINATSNVNLNGGTLRFNTASAVDLSRINYTAGTIKLAGHRNIGDDQAVASLFGNTPTIIPAGKALTVEGATTISNYNATVDGGRLTSQLNLDVGSSTNGHLHIRNGGTVVSGNAFIGSVCLCPGVLPGVTVSDPGSTWIINNQLFVGEPFDGTLDIKNQGLVYIESLLAIDPSGKVNLSGGTLRFDVVDVDELVRLNFSSGTIQLAGNRIIGADETIGKLFGATPAMTLLKSLTVEETATLDTVVTLDGGTLSAKQLVNGFNLRLQRGTLNLTNQAVTIALGGLLGNTLDLNDDMTVNVNLGITNQGLVTGDGQIGGTFTNAATGELRGEPGKSLKLTGGTFAATNAGRITLYGGLIEFTQNLFNNAGGFISGNGTLKTSTLNNSGTMNFAGTANILGTVTNNAGGKVISGGGGATIFYGDMTNNGEIRTSTNGFTVFFGSVSGSGTFTGTGTVNAEGDLSPGNSAAAISFGGDLVLGADASLQIEIGGLTAGTQHDKLTVAGDLSLDGALEVSLINGFIPSAGQSFNILDWLGTRTGTFSSLALPALAGLAWNTSQLYTTGVLSVASAGLPGDFNNNGTVDAADYVVWRKNDGTPAGYNTWRSHFGQTAGSGAAGYPLGASAESLSATVPEPASIAPLLFAMGSLFVFPRCRRVAKNRR